MSGQGLYIFISIAIVILLFLLTIPIFYIKKRGSSPKDVSNQELSYDDDGYDYAYAYTTPITEKVAHISIDGADVPSNQDIVEPVSTVENPYYGESYDICQKNGLYSSKRSKEAVNVVVHENVYYEKSWFYHKYQKRTFFWEIFLK